MFDTVQVEMKHYGKPFRMGEKGYVTVRAENIIAFHLDAWTDSGRAYPDSTSDWVFIPETKEHKHFPCIILDNGDEFESDFSAVYFPEFEGWKVHSVSGGKSLAICLVRKI